MKRQRHSHCSPLCGTSITYRHLSTLSRIGRHVNYRYRLRRRGIRPASVGSRTPMQAEARRISGPRAWFWPEVFSIIGFLPKSRILLRYPTEHIGSPGNSPTGATRQRRAAPSPALKIGLPLRRAREHVLGVWCRWPGRSLPDSACFKTNEFMGPVAERLDS